LESPFPFSPEDFAESLNIKNGFHSQLRCGSASMNIAVTFLLMDLYKIMGELRGRLIPNNFYLYLTKIILARRA